MRRGWLVALVVILSVAGCGGGSGGGSHAPTASTVSVQPGDLPAGMARCDLTGDIDNFLNKEKTADPSTYNSTKASWVDAKSKGATAAYTAFYTDSSEHCKAISSSSAAIGSAVYKLVVNFVIQFKDEASAAKGYTTEKVFNVSASDLKASASALTASGQLVVEGTKTGLSANSIVLNSPIANQSYYIAVWQNKAFLVILAILNVDPGAAKKVATSENARIA